MTITVTKTFATEAEAAAWLSGTGAPAAKAEAKTSAEAAPAPAASKPAAKATPKKPASEHTKEEMVAALNELKDAKGKEVARGVIRDVAGVAKMDEIPDDKIDAVYEAAKKAMEGDDDDGM